MAELRARPVAEFQHRRDEREGHDRDPHRHAEGEHVEREPLVVLPQEVVGDERGYDHQVVQHGGEGGQEEAPVGLQDAGADGAYAVEEHLQDEDAEEEHRETLDLFDLCRREVLRGLPVGHQPHERPGEDDAHEREDHHQRQHQGEQGVRQAAGVLLAVRGDPVHQHGDKDRVQYAAHEQLVDQARQQDRGRVGVGHQPGREDGGLGHPPPVPRHPRQNGRHGDREHRPQHAPARASACQHACPSVACQHVSARRACSVGSSGMLAGSVSCAAGWPEPKKRTASRGLKRC